MSPQSTVLLIPVIVSVSYYLTAVIGFEFALQPGSVSTLWMPNSILLAGLLLMPRRLWWLVVVAVLPAHFASELSSGVPTTMVLSWFVSNVAQALLAASCICWLVKDRLRFDRFRDLTIFILFGAFLAPFLSSFLDAALVRINGWGHNSYWDVWRVRFFSNVIATLTLVPVVMLWFSGGIAALRKASPLRYLEGALLFVGLLAVGILVFDVQLDLAAKNSSFVYLPLPFLLWATVRFGPRGTSTSLLLLMFLAILGATRGAGPFVTSSSASNALSIQLFLIVVSIPLMALAAVIEERRRADEENQERSRQIRNLATRLLSAQESERRRISLLLHDDVSQNIAALGLSISSLKRKLPATSQEIQVQLEWLGEQANDLTTQLRKLSHQLHPEVLEHLGLVAALESHVTEFGQEENIAMKFEADVGNDPLPFDLSACLYRVTLEALRNISRHSGARNGSVTLKTEAGHLMLEVADSGSGFDVEKARRGSGIGLLSTEERIKVFQGTLDIRSDPHNGTVLVARVPLMRSS